MRELPAEGSSWSANLPVGLLACFGLYEANGSLPVNIPALDEAYQPTDEILWPRGYAAKGTKTGGTDETATVSEGAEQQSAGLSAGGWVIVHAEAQTLPEDAQAAFDKATEGMTDVSYTPVALLSTQIIVGTNYCILCQITPVVPDPVPSWNLVYICSDPEGNARITNTWEIYVDRHAESDLVKQATE